MRTFGPGQTEFEMRGLNSSGGNTSMVGLYLDEIPLSSPALGQLGRNAVDPDLYDLSRVEVLRGPQGTLYGGSSMGGTIRLIPHAPELNTYAASAEQVVSHTFSGGNLNHQENAMLNLPLGSTAAVRIVGSFSRMSGWIERLVIADGAVAVDGGGTFPNVQRPANFYSAPLQEVVKGANTTGVDSIRAEVLWKPNEHLTIEPLLMYQLTQQGAPDEVDVNGNPTHPTTPLVKAHYEIYDTPEPQQDSLSFASLKLVYDLPWFSVTSATGFFHRNLLVSQDGTEETNAALTPTVYDVAAGGAGPTGPAPNGPGVVEQDYTRQLSEEFRVASKEGGPLQWIVGYFYQDLYSSSGINVINPQNPLSLGGPHIFVAYQPQVLTQNAFFGDATWRLSPHFELSAGLRHYHYSLNESNIEFGSGTVFGSQGDTVPFSSTGSLAASGTVPSFTLKYNVDADHMAYAKISKGFRLGGVNQPIPVVAATDANRGNPFLQSQVANECGLQMKVFLTTACNSNILLQAPTTFGSDSVWSYELGEKSSFIHDTVIANVDGFWESWRSPQVATNIAGFGITADGGEARIKGIEAQLQALLPMGFELSVNGAYTRAEFTQTSTMTGFAKGSVIPDTPEVTASAVLQWLHKMSHNLSLFGSLEEDYTGSRTDVPFGETLTVDTFNQLLLHLPAYSVVNLRFGVRGERSDGGSWSATLFVHNLTNNQAPIDPEPQINLQLSAFQRETINRPLTAGVDVTYQF
jgi:outer membrane receptor protein involved in Fe transport